MCLIVFSYLTKPERPLTLIANRDEFYDRPTTPANLWEDGRTFAGRDDVAGGTWLGITHTGRVAAVTNYREPGAPKGSRSRGKLVSDFLAGEMPAADYLSQIAASGNEFSGFNLLVGEITGDVSDLFYFSNRSGAGPQRLTPGVYGLSNHLLDTPWPKVRRAKSRFAELIENRPEQSRFFDLLEDQTLAPDNELPDTGIGIDRERLLSPIFIRTPIYGTRSSTVVSFSKVGPTLVERVHV